jgi:glycosyltransferase involved in cell wall biosynthesis
MSTVSVIIPAYNAANFIVETIRSVIEQTFTDWELIISDDGSTDNTEAAVKPFLNHQIRYVKHPNGGVSLARNRGAAIATGKYLAFLDADDVLTPESLKKKVQVLQEHPEIAVVFCDVAIIDEKSDKTGVELIGSDEDILKHLLLWDKTVIPGPSSILVTREAYDAVEGFDPAFSTAADQDFFFRIAGQFMCHRIPEVLTLYRKHGSNMHMNIRRMEQDHIGVYQKAVRLNLFETSSFKRHCFANLYLILAGSWWVNGNNKCRALLFLIKTVMMRPAHVTRILKKLA